MVIRNSFLFLQKKGQTERGEEIIELWTGTAEASFRGGTYTYARRPPQRQLQPAEEKLLLSGDAELGSPQATACGRVQPKPTARARSTPGS